MTNKLEIYRCKVCGNIVQILIDGMGELHCCGEALELMEVQTDEPEKGEYHVPVKIHSEENSDFIQVGKEPHPMTNEHHIKFIQVISDNKKYLKMFYLNPDEEPKAYLKNNIDGNYCMLELCNIHGLWGGKDVK